jgi:hypothetical protein
MASLSVEIDGRPAPPEDAAALWKRFSAWMDAHKGDLAGFAREEGFASVHPELRGGAPVLVVSRTATQRPYVTAPSKPGKPPGSKARR